MCKVKCKQCSKEYNEIKSSTGICGSCLCKNKRKEEQRINLETEKYNRNCPVCNSKIVYKNERRYLKALKENCKCKKCTAIQQFKNLDKDIKAGKRENGFKGKTHSEKTIEKLKKVDRSYMSNPDIKLKISNSMKLKHKLFPQKSFYDSWLEKYGKKVADRKLDEFKSKISKSVSGKNNGMYGKPSPQGSGNGWSGWYKDIYFRSLLELSFLVNWANRFNLKIESAEKQKYGIKYNFNNNGKTYFSDWIVNSKYLVEIKPKKLWSTPQNRAKFKAAKEYCKENNLIFKVIEPIKLTEDDLNILYETKQIKFNRKYEEKFKNKFKK